MPSPAADLVVLDTIGKLYAHGHGLNGYCRTCRRYFGASMSAPIAMRGANSPVVGMRSLTCAPFAALRRRGDTDLRLPPAVAGCSRQRSPESDAIVGTPARPSQFSE
jgi:hypothetical protein